MCADEVYPVDSSGGGVGYYGWTNWDTWNANLWLTNFEVLYSAAMNAVNPDDLQHCFRMYLTEEASATGYRDGIDPNKVNWQEIFDSLHEGEEDR